MLSDMSLALAIAKMPACVASVLLLRSCSIEVTVANQSLRRSCWRPTLLLTVVCVYSSYLLHQLHLDAAE